MYYDPVVDVHHRLPVSLALVTSYYAAPQVPDDAQRLFTAAYQSAGLGADLELPLRATRGYPTTLLLAREWGLAELEERMAAAIETSYEPTWDDATGEFTWGLGLNEPHPRGQFNAFLAAAEAGGPGRWTALSAEPIESCPQIVDVDFPTLALNRAEWIDGALHIGLAPLREDPSMWTTFRLIGAEPRLWYLSGLDGATMDTTADSTIIRVPLVKAELQLTPGSY